MPSAHTLATWPWHAETHYKIALLQLTTVMYGPQLVPMTHNVPGTHTQLPQPSHITIHTSVQATTVPQKRALTCNTLQAISQDSSNNPKAHNLKRLHSS